MSTHLQISLVPTPGSPDPTTEEAAAAVAAIMSLIAAGSDGEETVSEPARWRDAAKLVAQGLTPTRVPAKLGWATIERLRRAGKGGSGITGM